MISLAAGAITDSNGPSTNVIGDDLTLAAVAGIGSGDALETEVNRLQATNTDNGIEISNTGALVLADINTLGYAVSNTNGWINIAALSPLSVNADVIAGGDIELVAGDDDASANDNLAIAANVDIQSTAGNILLQAGDDITQAAGTGIIAAGGGFIDIIAGHDNDGDGMIDIAGTIGSGAEALYAESDEAMVITTNVATLSALTDDADITVTEEDGLGLNLVDAGSGDVSLTVLVGDLTDNNGASNNVTADLLTLDVAGDIGASGDAIDTTVTTLAIAGATNAYINETNDINLSNITVTDLFSLVTHDSGTVESDAGTTVAAGTVNINADGVININTDADIATLATTNDDITVNEADGLTVNMISAGTGDVTLVLAAGAVTDNNTAGVNNITADELSVTAPAGVDLDTTVNTLTANTAGANGNIVIREASGLALNNVNAGSGDITLTLAAGALESNVGTKITGDQVVLTGPAGINVNTNINQLTATATNSDIRLPRTAHW